MPLAALERERNPNSSLQLAGGLVSVTEKMTKQDAARLCSRAARVIAGEIEKDSAVFARTWPARQPNRPDGGEHDLPAGDPLRYQDLQPPEKLQLPDRSTIALISHLESKMARRLATELAPWICAENNMDIQTLDEVLTERERNISNEPGLPVLRPVRDQQTQSKPLPCRLATQDLVELLKMPTYFGMARGLVLDHLSNRYGRQFFNHWDFVRFAQEQNLGLDLTTPPKRPDPKESVERMLEILDGAR